jgi:hypothetical protein
MRIERLVRAPRMKASFGPHALTKTRLLVLRQRKPLGVNPVSLHTPATESIPRASNDIPVAGSGSNACTTAGWKQRSAFPDTVILVTAERRITRPAAVTKRGHQSFRLMAPITLKHSLPDEVIVPSSDRLPFHPRSAPPQQTNLQESVWSSPPSAPAGTLSPLPASRA